MYEDFYLDTAYEDRYDCMGDEPVDNEPIGGYAENVCDYDEGDDAYALASAGHGSDEDYGGGEDCYLDSQWEDQFECMGGGDF